MNREKFDFILEHVALQQAIPSRINFRLADDFDPRLLTAAYSRVNWRTGDTHIAELEFETTNGRKEQILMRFMVETRTRIVKIGESGVPPDDQDPEEADVIMDAEISFMVEYALIDAKPGDFDEEAMKEFCGKNVPFVMWPYYRELIQSLAVRARIPPPQIPAFRVPKSHQNGK